MGEPMMMLVSRYEGQIVMVHSIADAIIEDEQGVIEIKIDETEQRILDEDEVVPEVEVQEVLMLIEEKDEVD